MNNLISKLVSIKRTRNQQKLFNQIRKQYRTRKYIINEIVNTEKKYLDDLKLIQELVIDKFKRISSPEETQKVFSNLDEIITVNQVLYDKLVFRIEKANKDYFRDYQLKGDDTKLLGHENSLLFQQIDNSEILKNFEAYYQYCEHYDQALKYRNELRKSDETFKQVLAEAQRNPKLQQMEVEDFLVKPVQRLPKYILLLKDLKKNTPNYKYFTQLCCMKNFIHPDYDNICKYLIRFEDINDKNNQKIGEFQNRQKMIEIQKQYGSPQLIIDNNIRQFIFEENVELYVTSSNRKNVHLICFNDTLLVIEIEYSTFFGPKKKIISFAEFSLGSEVNLIESQKGLLFKVTTKNKVFIFVASDIKQLTKIQTLLKDSFQQFLALKKKMLSNSGQESQQSEQWDQLQLIVSVEGTEEYNIASLQNYTVYIIKFSLQAIEWKVYLRYSQIKAISNIILTRDVGANVVKLQKSNWLRNHDNKYLDSIKINIEGFIQSIFQWKKFQNHIGKILPELGLPLNFHLLPKVVGNQNEMSKFHKSSSLVENEDSVLQICDKLQQKLKEELQLEKLLKEHIKQELSESQKVRIFIPYPCFQQFKSNDTAILIGKQEHDDGNKAYLIINVDKLMKAMELCERIADAIQLKIFFDFRLIVVDSRGNKRCLDHNQIVLQSLPEDNNILPAVNKFLRFFDENYSLEFTKYIYFPQKIEQSLYKNDVSRLYFLCEILFTEARNYGLSNQDYSLLCALSILMNNTEQKYKLDFDRKFLQKLILLDVIKTWQDSTWKKNTENHLKALGPELQKIAQHNQKLKEESDIPTDQARIFTEKTLLARIMALNKAFKMDLFGLTTFYIGINMRDEKNQQFHKLLDADIPNLYLGVQYNSVLLLSPGKKKMMYQFNINLIEQIKVEPIYLFMTITNTEKMFDFKNYELKLKTVEGYKISQLIKFYMEINLLYPQINQMKKYEIH